jgi:tripartite-type tricarboxylate transporter receptor subunit TctC
VDPVCTEDRIVATSIPTGFGAGPDRRRSKNAAQRDDACLDRRHPLRALVVLDTRRSAKLPGVPTAAEFGYSVTTASFGGIYAPVGLPRDVRATLSAACAKVGQSAALKTTLERLGADLIHLDSEAFAQRLATDRKAKGEAVKALNLTVE